MTDVKGEGEDASTPPERDADATSPSVSVPWWKRGFTKIVAALLAGAVAGVTALATEGVISIGHKLVAAEVLSIQTQVLSPQASCNFRERGWVFPKPPQSLPVPDLAQSGFDVDAWAKQNGGVPASGYYVVLTLQPVQQRTVVIDDLSVRIVRRSPPTVGTYSMYIAQCGGVEPSSFQANLDTNPVFVKPIQGVNDAGEIVKPVPLPHEVTENEPEVWNVSAVTEQCTCQWIIEVHWTSGKDSGTVQINNHGVPFVTSSTVGSVRADADYGHPPRWTIEPSDEQH